MLSNETENIRNKDLNKKVVSKIYNNSLIQKKIDKFQYR